MSLTDRLKTAAKIAVSLIVLVLLLIQVPLGEVISTIPELGPVPSVTLLALLIIEVLLSTLSIYVLTTHYTDVTYREMFKIDSMNFIANTFIPSRLGSIVSMPILIDRYTTADKTEGAVIQTTQMVLVTLITGVTAGIGWLLFHGQLSYEISVTLALCVLLYLGFPGIIITATLLSDLAIIQQYVVSRLPVTEVQKGIRIDVRRVLTSSGCLIATRVFTAAARLWVLSIAFGLDLELFELLFIPTLMYSVTVLPISLGGVGIAEASGTAVLVGLDAPVAIAATVIFVDRIFTTYLPLLGFYVYVNLTGLPEQVRDKDMAEA